MTYKVYLAGGFHSDWNEQIKKRLNPNIWTVLDPREHGIKDPNLFTPMDIGMIEMSDVVVGRIESSNPGLNIYFELGWAARAGKTIVLWLDHDLFTHIPERYMGMMLRTASFIAHDPTSVCVYLKERFQGI